jgi:CRISPR-associated protein Csx3
VRDTRVEIDPVLDPGLDGLRVTVPVGGAPVEFRFTVGSRGHGARAVRSGGVTLDTQEVPNRYRPGGVSVPFADLVGGRGLVEVEVP